MPKTNSKPQIGIFWVFRGKVLAATAPLEDGAPSAESLDSPHDHVRVWPTLQQKNPALRSLEYEEIPRGRIVFIKRTKQFHVYADKALHTPTVKRLILATFQIPRARAVFLGDSHYTTDAAD